MKAIINAVPVLAVPDSRYTVNQEFMGKPEKKWVARFINIYIGYGDTEQEAIELCHQSYNSRMKSFTPKGWDKV